MSEKPAKKVYKVVAKVVSQKGICRAGHKVDDEFVLGRECPAGICGWAYCALHGRMTVLAYGGIFPWTEAPDYSTLVACPDANNPVVFKLRRLEEAYDWHRGDCRPGPLG